MAEISRRQFIAGTTAAVGAAAFAGRRAFADGAKKITSGTDIVTLGRSGIKTSVLGVGTGTHGGNDQVDIGQEAFTRMIRHALERGIRYIDTADMYKTHLFVRLALKGVAREKYFIQTKTTAKHPEVAKADIERFRQELRIDHLDTLLMHCMTTGSWQTDMRPVMDVLQDAKAKGRVRAVGISCHGFEPLAASVDCDWIDVQLARINPFGKIMDGEPADVAALLKKMHDSGRGVLGMKIFGEGQIDTPEKRFESLKYVLGLGSVDAFTIGFVSTEQIDDTLEMIARALA